MSYQNPFNYLDINVNNIIYKNIKESNNKKIIFVKYNNNLTNFVFQVPTLNNKIIVNNNELDINISCKNNNKSSSLNTYFDKLDNKVIEDAKKNNVVWFDHLKDKTDINYHYIVTNNNSFKVKCINSSEFSTSLYLNDETKINLENIPNNGTFKIILEFYAIWINNNNFGILLRPIVLSFYPDYKIEYNYKFLDTEIDNELDSDNILANKLCDILNNNSKKIININQEEKEINYINIINSEEKKNILNNTSDESDILNNTSQNNNILNNTSDENNISKNYNNISNNYLSNNSDSDNSDSDNSDNEISDYINNYKDIIDNSSENIFLKTEIKNPNNLLSSTSELLS